MKRVTAMKETSYNVEAKGSETIHIENEVCSRISLRLYIKGGSIEKGAGADHCWCFPIFTAHKHPQTEQYHPRRDMTPIEPRSSLTAHSRGFLIDGAYLTG